MKLEIKAAVAGTVFKLETTVGAQVAAGASLMVLESMKMEISVDAPSAGVVVELLVGEQDVVKEGQVVAILG